jgi:hypothetical protein
MVSLRVRIGNVCGADPRDFRQDSGIGACPAIKRKPRLPSAAINDIVNRRQREIGGFDEMAMFHHGVQVDGFVSE